MCGAGKVGIIKDMNKRIIGLMVLSAVPLLSALTRLVDLSTGALQLEGQARFSADPLLAVLHVSGSTAFATLGPLQFIPSLRRHAWHRLVGRALGLFGVAAAVSGVLMAWRWPAKAFEGPLLNTIRVAVACALVAFMVVSVLAARRGDFRVHEVWMTRAYALWAGGGTQAFTMMPFFVPTFEGLRSEWLYAVLMAAGWAINLAVAEWTLRAPVAA